MNLEVISGVRKGVAHATLNRPAALNALTLGMLHELTRLMQAWAADDSVKVIVFRGAGDKAFCAGGDIRALHDGFKAGVPGLLDYFAIEYSLDHDIHHFPKPVVAVMDGVVMGGGMGLAQGAALRIVGDRTKMAMPETAIGLFPDVGGGYFLHRAPGHLPMYLGLVGPTLRAADCLYTNLADAYFTPEALVKLDTALEQAAASADPRASVLALGKSLGAEPPEPAALPSLRTAIDRHFDMPSVPAIIASLHSETDPAHEAWAKGCLAALAKRSPTMLAVTFEQITRGASLSLAEDLRMELNLVHGCFDQGDFIEGIRALIVDKDNAPRWNPASPDAVTSESVAAFFSPRWTPETHPLAHLGMQPGS